MSEVTLPDGSIGHVHHFVIYNDENQMLVEDVNGKQIPIVFASMPVIVGKRNTPRLVTPNNNRPIMLH